MQSLSIISTGQCPRRLTSFATNFFPNQTLYGKLSLRTSYLGCQCSHPLVIVASRDLKDTQSPWVFGLVVYPFPWRCQAAHPLIQVRQQGWTHHLDTRSWVCYRHHKLLCNALLCHDNSGNHWSIPGSAKCDRQRFSLELDNWRLQEVNSGLFACSFFLFTHYQLAAWNQFQVDLHWQ